MLNMLKIAPLKCINRHCIVIDLMCAHTTPYKQRFFAFRVCSISNHAAWNSLLQPQCAAQTEHKHNDDILNSVYKQGEMHHYFV